MPGLCFHCEESLLWHDQILKKLEGKCKIKANIKFGHVNFEILLEIQWQKWRKFLSDA